jgi:hypothetical protein
MEELPLNHLTGLKLFNYEAIFADIVPGHIKKVYYGFLFFDLPDCHGPGSIPE